MKKPTVDSALDPEMLRAYETASSEEKRKIRTSLRSHLQDCASNDSRSLEQLMDEIGDQAKARGMTTEILDSILKGD